MSPKTSNHSFNLPRVNSLTPTLLPTSPIQISPTFAWDGSPSTTFWRTGALFNHFSSNEQENASHIWKRQKPSEVKPLPRNISCDTHITQAINANSYLLTDVVPSLHECSRSRRTCHRHRNRLGLLRGHRARRGNLHPQSRNQRHLTHYNQLRRPVLHPRTFPRRLRHQRGESGLPSLPRFKPSPHRRSHRHRSYHPGSRHRHSGSRSQRLLCPA